MNYFHKNLKIVRKHLKFTQKTVSEKIGIKLSAYSSYEEGRAYPNYDTLIKIGLLLNTSLDELLKENLYDKIDYLEYSDKKIENTPRSIKPMNALISSHKESKKEDELMRNKQTQPMRHCQARRYLYSWGIKNLLIELAYRERIEDFEACAAIRCAIEYHNEIVEDNKPTRLEYLNQRKNYVSIRD